MSKCVKDIRSFLGRAGFYRRFIKDFSKIVRPLTNLLTKDVSFTFNDECINSSEKLKKELISAPIISARIGQSRSKSCATPLILPYALS